MTDPITNYLTAYASAHPRQTLPDLRTDGAGYSLRMPGGVLTRFSFRDLETYTNRLLARAKQGSA